MQRNGWMRIVEASLSILFILSVLFFLYNREAQSESLALDEKAQNILAELASKGAFREAVLSRDEPYVHQAVAAKIPESHLLFEARICGLDEVCGKSNFTEGNVYAAERVISSSLEKNPSSDGAVPKKVRLFVWRTVAR